ncbi:synaptic transmission protein complexin [Brevipalpus obovatus]|uniref:synaptic transmission protein complexin n=1 Tax=Brevipalpus obovatus TaxID=246614 RepID=UPI003D9E717E
MAAFIAKQMVGNQLSAVKDIGGGGGESAEEKEKLEELERERLEALREAEDRRREKHRKLEEEREKMRQGVREKYGIKKREEKEEEMRKQQEALMKGVNPSAEAGGLNRSKKTPEELAAEAAAQEQDEFTKIRTTIETQVNELKNTIEGKCIIQ